MSISHKAGRKWRIVYARPLWVSLCGVGLEDLDTCAGRRTGKSMSAAEASVTRRLCGVIVLPLAPRRRAGGVRGGSGARRPGEKTGFAIGWLLGCRITRGARAGW